MSNQFKGKRIIVLSNYTFHTTGHVLDGESNVSRFTGEPFLQAELEFYLINIIFTWNVKCSTALIFVIFDLWVDAITFNIYG